MPYGTIKVDNIVFTNSGVDQTIGVSGLVQSISGNLTATGTISGNIIRGTTVSGTTVTGGVGQFTTITGGVLSVTSGVFAPGTSGAPSISFSSDSNTGFWSPAGDTVAISTGGFERIRVDGDGDLGVGTTDPTSRLTVRSDATSGPNTIIRVENRAASAGATTQNIKVEGIFDYNNGASDASAGAIVFGKEGTYTTATTNNDSYLAFETTTDNSSTEKLRINSTGQVVTTISGTAAAPALSVGNDLNTGIYSPGADQVAISTNGTGRLFVDASGNVGINSAGDTGGSKFYIVGNATAGLTNIATIRTGIGNSYGLQIKGNYTTEDYLIQNYYPGALAFGTNNTERMRLDSSGRLGLGTSSPSDVIDLVGNIRISTNKTDNTNKLAILLADQYASNTETEGATLLLGSFTSTANSIRIGGSGSSYNAATDIRLFTAADTTTRSGTERMIIDSSGRVGIGVTGPTKTLEVKGDARFYNATDANSAILDITADATGSNGVNLASTYFGSGGFGPIRFTTSNTERARIDSSGRLLVGTSTAVNSSLFQVVGNDSARPTIHRNINDEYDSALLLTKARGTGTQIVSNNDSIGAIAFRGADGTNFIDCALIRAQIDGTPGANDMPGRLVFSTTADGASSPTERMRIDNSGRILINSSTTPAAATMLIRGGPAGTNAAHLQITTATSTFGGGRISVTTTGGGLEFFTHTGNVGAETYTEAMRINSAQELLIGYTSDNGAYKLQVNSQIFATSATIATSDGRYKQNVATLGGCLGLVKALRPVSFTWKPQEDVTRIDDDGNEVLVREGHNFPEGTQVGFIAQEVQEVLADKPWLGSVIKENVRPAILDDDGNELAPEEQFYGIAEGNLIAVLTNALQEAVAEIESLKARLDAADL